MIITQASQQTLVDLAIDSPPISAPTITVLGPTLAPLELSGRKLLALFSRAEPRDFADVYLLAQRFGKQSLASGTQCSSQHRDGRTRAHRQTLSVRWARKTLVPCTPSSAGARPEGCTSLRHLL